MPTCRQEILALSWRIATQPRLYRELASNPYSHLSLQIISAIYPNYPVSDVIRAVILAEPEGDYDRNYKQLPNDQLELLIKLQNLLIYHCGLYTKELGRQSDELIYSRLLRAVFGSADSQQIEQQYSQYLRRELKLSIINFIETDKQVLVLPLFPLLKLTLVTLSLLLFLYPLNNLSVKQIPVTDKQVLATNLQEEPRGLPVRLKIPSLKIDADVEQVGMTPEGAMDVPSNTTDVGWFSLGPRPGERGSAVISGHLDERTGRSGVFDKLDKLEPGDRIYVTDDLGTITTFSVRENRIYDQGYSQEVFVPNDNSYLNLITCDGVWDETANSYSKRLVVFASITDEPL